MPFETEIKAVSDKTFVPFYLLCEQVRQESNFNPRAVSHCGARGLLQLMPAAGREMGLKEDEEFFDVAKNLDAGARYLRKQYFAVSKIIDTLPKGALKECTDGDYWMLALAAYNGGLGYVLKAINLCVYDALAVRWETVDTMLRDDRCKVRGKRPDHKQISDYVRKIWIRYRMALGT